MCMVLSYDTSHLESSPGSSEWSDACRTVLPTLRPSQPTFTESLPVGCYCLYPQSAFIITHPES